MNNDVVISLKNISKFYKLYSEPKDRLKEALHPGKKKYHKEFFALQDINLEIKKGEILGIVGKNGCGKSTLLKIISGVMGVSSGSLTIKGKISALLELGSGFNPEFTGIQNIFFYGTILGFSKKEMEAKLSDILAFAEIGEYIHQPLKTYSSGMKSRLGFSVAVHIEPEILILDEVLSVGDALFQRKCYAKMDEFFKSGKTVLYVSHNANSVNELCTRAILIDEGKILLDGEPKVITSCYQKYLFSKEKNVRKILQEIEKNIQVIEDKKKPIATLENKGEKDGDSYYLDGFIPKNTLEYKNEDVEISELKITTPTGRQVNVLSTNEQYIYSYKVKFGLSVEKATFGSQIITQKGLLISAAGLHHNDQSVNVKKNDIYVVEWKFICKLLSGDYFMHVGVASEKNGEWEFLNRITDALAFRVQDKKYIEKGLVSLDQEVTFSKVN